jgi:excisionase family DNA binding protein
MVTPDEAAQLCQVSTRTIYRRIETGRLHFMETEKGFSLICIQSLESSGRPTQSSDEAIARAHVGFFRNSMKRMLKRR